MVSIPPRLFPQRVTVQVSGEYDDFGQPISGVSTTYPARVSTASRVIRSAGGTEVVTKATVYISGDVSIPNDATVTLPTDGRTHEILSVQRVIGAQYVEYTEVNVS